MDGPAPGSSGQLAAQRLPGEQPSLSARGRGVGARLVRGHTTTSRNRSPFSTDAGRTFGTPVRLDNEGSLGRVDVELFPTGPRSRPTSSSRTSALTSACGASPAPATSPHPSSSRRSRGIARAATRGWRSGGTNWCSHGLIAPGAGGTPRPAVARLPGARRSGSRSRCG